MPRQVLTDGRTAWRKSYRSRAGARRVLRLAWNLVLAAAGLPALRSPPRHQGEMARRVEMRRIRALQGSGVLVPDILDGGDDWLLLGDLGSSLSELLKTRDDRAELDGLVGSAIDAIATVHARHAYLGQPFARNLTVLDGTIGFIDFEEDPLEIMPLPDAQARDWLMFCAGVARHYGGRTDSLAAMLARGLADADPRVVDSLRRAARRLAFVERITRRMNVRARALGLAVASIRAAVAAPGA